MIRIMRSYTLQAAHRLPRVPDGHKCGRLHGHTYEIEIWVAGEPDERGWFMDFAELDVAWNARVHATIEHRYLNDFIENPTTENLCAFIAERLALEGLCKIVACENGHSAVEWTP